MKGRSDVRPDLYSADNAGRLHARGDIYRVAPHVVEEFSCADDAGDDGARLNSDSKRYRLPVGIGQITELALDGERKVCNHFGMAGV